MEFENDRYSIQGVDLIDLAGEHGTPLYVYDGARIEDQYKSLTNAFNGLKLKIKYAVKALSNISILKLMKSIGAEIDAVSIQEVEIALKACC